MKKKLIITLLFLLICCMFGCKEEQIYIVKYTVNEGGRISGGATQEVVAGGDAEIVMAVNYDNYHFIGWSDGVTSTTRTDINIVNNFTVEAIFEHNDDNFPTLSINTFNVPVNSKDVYVNCEVSVEDIDYPEHSFTNYTAKIKGRGNSTWGMPKKPYKLKFEDKVDLFGNGKAKTWTLIANYCDKSLSRNYLAYKIASFLETDKVTSTTKFVELYMNQTYQGLYLVCEQVEVGKNRVDISDDYSSLNTGYLIELDYKVYEEPLVLNEDYFLIDNIPYGIKYPEKEDVNIKENVQYIKGYLERCSRSLKSGTYSEVQELMDVNSFANQYIVQELFKNVDVKHSSWYLYKDKDGKLCNGPTWDMDITCGNCDYDNQVRIDYMYAKNMNYWYKLLFKFPEFQNIVKIILVENYYTLQELINTTIDDLYDSKQYFDRNFTKWTILGKYVWPNPISIVKLNTWDQNIEQLRTWLNESLAYMFNYYQQD